jgi:hypothetical protein
MHTGRRSEMSECCSEGAELHKQMVLLHVHLMCCLVIRDLPSTYFCYLQLKEASCQLARCFSDFTPKMLEQPCAHV